MWLVEHHPDAVEGCTEAIGEVGGFSLTVRDDLRLYLVQTAEKGMAWLNLIADGRAGHGSFRNDDNAVTELAAAVARIGTYEWPHRITDAQQAFLEAVSDAFGIELDPDRAEETLARLGSIARMVGATMSQHREPDDAAGGLQAQRHPGPGDRGDRRPVRAGRPRRVLRDHHRAARGQGPLRDGDVTSPRSRPSSPAPWWRRCRSCLVAEDPGARAVPYLMSGGTDAKAWDRRGIRCFGFAPLRLPPDLDFVGLFHGVDERVPTESLEFGARVLDRFLDQA